MRAIASSSPQFHRQPFGRSMFLLCSSSRGGKDLPVFPQGLSYMPQSRHASSSWALPRPQGGILFPEIPQTVLDILDLLLLGGNAVGYAFSHLFRLVS